MAEDAKWEDDYEGSVWQKAVEGTATSTPTAYDRIAATLIQKLLDFEAAVPEAPGRRYRNRDAQQFIRSKHGVRRDFINKSIGMLLISENLKNIPQLDHDTTQASAEYVRALRPIVQQVKALYNTLKLKVDLEQAHLAADAQQIYTVAKGLALGDDRAMFGEEIAIMKRAVRKKRKPKSEPEPSE